MAEKEKTRVLIIDDDPDVREIAGISLLFLEEGEARIRAAPSLVSS